VQNTVFHVTDKLYSSHILASGWQVDPPAVTNCENRQWSSVDLQFQLEIVDLFALSTSNHRTRRPPLTSSSSNITPGISGPHPYFLRTYHNRIPVQQN